MSNIDLNTVILVREVTVGHLVLCLAIVVVGYVVGWILDNRK